MRYTPDRNSQLHLFTLCPPLVRAFFYMYSLDICREGCMPSVKIEIDRDIKMPVSRVVYDYPYEVMDIGDSLSLIHI